ncbi:fimbrial biogenesis chaperone [Glaciimonas immobilis]|nr:fimbria/pilus periplasmic chaperone [Glaciimonas immobilis]
MFPHYFTRTCAVALLSFGCATHAAASISVGGTRVIYDAAKREASVSIRNLGNAPYVVQAWIDAGRSVWREINRHWS